MADTTLSAALGRYPYTLALHNGRVRPSDAPGFGLEITKEWLESRTA